MTKPYSMDFREKAIARVEAGESRRSVAKALGVSPSAIVKWSQRHRATGSVAPAQIGGYAPKKIRGEYADWLQARVQGGDDFTLPFLPNSDPYFWPKRVQNGKKFEN